MQNMLGIVTSSSTAGLTCESLTEKRKTSLVLVYVGENLPPTIGLHNCDIIAVQKWNDG